MSAVRRDIIHTCGQTADSLGLVGNSNWKLPDVWPGDEAGQTIFPDAETAGRQIYRIGYTGVSFTTLGSAAFAYLDSIHQTGLALVDEPTNSIFFWISVFSSAISIGSLFNPSPLSLVPVYEAGTEDGQGQLLRRNDNQKLVATGMTRITRHPLILPVVPWGLATAASLGGQPRDYLLFGGLALYALAGCAAQDLRISNEEGSVGTVFSPDQSLQVFFRETSFLPFGALLDGRQTLRETVEEIPWLALAVGIPVGFKLQLFLLHWLSARSVLV